MSWLIQITHIYYNNYKESFIKHILQGHVSIIILTLVLACGFVFVSFGIGLNEMYEVY